MTDAINRAREAAIRAAWNDHARNEKGSLDTSVNAAIDAFLSELRTSHAVVPREGWDALLAYAIYQDAEMTPDPVRSLACALQHHAGHTGSIGTISENNGPAVPFHEYYRVKAAVMLAAGKGGK